MSAEADGWYWCRAHGRPERAGHQCRADDVLGPYPTEDAARHWREQVEERNEAWEAEDRRWEGEDED